jgi:hypothetical protein
LLSASNNAAVAIAAERLLHLVSAQAQLFVFLKFTFSFV